MRTKQDDDRAPEHSTVSGVLLIYAPSSTGTCVGEYGNVSNVMEGHHPRGMMEGLSCCEKQHEWTSIIPRVKAADLAKHDTVL
jgi:hypothetical protein